MGEATSSDCQGVKFAIGLATKEMYVPLKNGSKSNYVLNYSNSLGDSIDGLVTGTKYISEVLYRGAIPDTYYLLLLSRSNADKASPDNKLPPLKQPAAACSGNINLSAKLKGGTFTNFYSNTFTLQLDKYAVILSDIVVTDDTVRVNDPSPEGLAWLKDQLDHADKVTGTEPSAPEASAAPAATQNAPRKRPGFSPFPNGLGNKRGFPRLPPGVGPPGGQR